jgi:hypothetical protein
MPKRGNLFLRCLCRDIGRAASGSVSRPRKKQETHFLPDVEWMLLLYFAWVDETGAPPVSRSAMPPGRRRGVVSTSETWERRDRDMIPDSEIRTGRRHGLFSTSEMCAERRHDMISTSEMRA